MGKEVPFDERNFQKIEEFILKGVYKVRYPRSNAARAQKWKSMKKKNTARLSPDPDSILQHIKRANYQAFVFQNYDSPEAPPAKSNNGWTKTNEGTVPVMFTQPSVPKTIKTLVEKQ